MNRSQKVRHFEILRRGDGSPWELGRGAMGVTYKAWDTHLHCTVALKVIHPELLDSGNVRERFHREAQAAAQLRHPNIATASHLGTTAEGGLFYAMEFCDGVTLQSEVTAKQALDARTALDVAIQVSRAFAASEGRHLVHGDIKPANIMLVKTPGGDQLVKVIDFGLARYVSPNRGSVSSGANGFMGTVHYASPEQLGERAVDIRSDFYSLGACLWFMLTGRPIFEGPVARVMAQVLSSEPAWDSLNQPAPVIAMLRRLLAKSPDDRPANVRQLRDELEFCREKLGANPPPLRRLIPGSTTTFRAPLGLSRRAHVNLNPPGSPRRVTVRRRSRIGSSSQKPDLILGFCQPMAEAGRNALGVILNGVDSRTGRAACIHLWDAAVMNVPSIRRRYIDLVQGLQAHPHPSLPRILGCGDHGGEWAVVSDPITGMCARDIMKSRGRLLPAEALEILSPVADALAHASTRSQAPLEVHLGTLWLASRQQAGREHALLATPLGEWGGIHVTIDVLSPASEAAGGPAQGSLTSMPTAFIGAQGIAPGGTRIGGDAMALAGLLYELLGCPVPPAGQYVPLPRLNEASNNVVREARLGRITEGGGLIRQLQAALGSQTHEPTAPLVPESAERSRPAVGSPVPRGLLHAALAVGILVPCAAAWFAWHHHISDLREQERVDRTRQAQIDSVDLEKKQQEAEDAWKDSEKRATEAAQARIAATTAQAELDKARLADAHRTELARLEAENRRLKREAEAAWNAAAEAQADLMKARGESKIQQR
jgi:serine/threonine protein kinase